MSYTNTSTMSLFNNNAAHMNALQFQQNLVSQQMGSLRLASAPHKISPQSAISKATHASQQTMAVDGGLSAVQSMCQLNGQFASVQILAQLRSVMTQLNTQLLSMAPQMDSVHKQLQSRRQLNLKPSMSMANKLGLPSICVDTDDCVSVASSDDDCRSTSSMSPCASPSPCPSFASTIASFSPASPSFSISSGNSDTLSIISDYSESSCDAEAAQYSVDAMWERKPLCSAMQTASAEDLVHGDSKADIAKVACDRVKGANIMLALRKRRALKRASKSKKCTRSSQQH